VSSEKSEPICPIEIVWILTVRRVRSFFILGAHSEPGVQVSALYWHSIHQRSHIQIRAMPSGNISSSNDRGPRADLGGPEVKCESTFGWPKSDILPIPI